MSSTHTIGQHRFRVTVASEKEAYFLFEVISELANTKLPAMLDELLSQHAPEARVIQIDRLRLDLGEFPVSGFGEVLLGRLPNTLQVALEEELKHKEKIHMIGETIFIKNAGIIILAPFLFRYFSTLNMLDGTAFVSEEQAIRGVLLLQYVATGMAEAPEHQLAFNKILCGLPSSTPVPTSIKLTEEEKTVSNQLLNAVLQNWDKLKNSSVENLRGSFLLRTGKLSVREESWSLKVESRGYDILLRFLPWTISIVRLPWIEKHIEVDWNTQMS